MAVGGGDIQLARGASVAPGGTTATESTVAAAEDAATGGTPEGSTPPLHSEVQIPEAEIPALEIHQAETPVLEIEAPTASTPMLEARDHTAPKKDGDLAHSAPTTDGSTPVIEAPGPTASTPTADGGVPHTARSGDESRTGRCQEAAGMVSPWRVLFRCFGREFVTAALWKPLWFGTVVLQVSRWHAGRQAGRGCHFVEAFLGRCTLSRHW